MQNSAVSVSMRSFAQTRPIDRDRGKNESLAPSLPPWDRSSSDIYRSFQRHLLGWQSRYAARPEREMLRLYLLALEREENVAVAYDQNVLGPRLAAMHLPNDVRDLIWRALASIWADERRHALYVRQTLRRLNNPIVAASALLHRTAGALGGWAVSVRQHRRWSDAPLAHAVATLLTYAGALSGRVPTEVRPHLRYSTFREFCRYNVHTESTAWLCWERLAQLAERVPDLSSGAIDEFRNVAEDEEHHRRVFEVLAGALTDDDRLHPGVSLDELSARIEAAGRDLDGTPSCA